MKKTIDAATSDAANAAQDAASRFHFDEARTALERWFATNGRVFPWRSDATPFRVWISEIMLQQTTTQTVVGYFERFLRRFPDVATLAASDEEEVLKYWEGLGYYRRARSLRAAAREIVDRFGGDFPSELDDVLSLPGVGRYTAGAILSFGFDRRSPILEANTTRLHARILGLRLETTNASAQKILWNFAENWLPFEKKVRESGAYRRLNGALTDLGRLVCAPSEPNCGACPLADFCESRRQNWQNDVPILKKKTETIERTDVAFWISRCDLFDVSDASASDVLLIRRPENALWAGLWDFPRFEITNAEYRVATDFSGDSTLNDRLQLFLEEEVGATPFDYRAGNVLKTFKHAATKFRITLRFCRLRDADSTFDSGREKSLFDLLENAAGKKSNALLKRRPDEKKIARRDVALPESIRVASEIRWVPLAELDAYPLSSTGRRLARFVESRSNDADAKNDYF